MKNRVKLDSEFEYLRSKLYFTKYRNREVVRVKIDGKFFDLQRVILQFPKERIRFISDDRLDFRKENLELIVADIKLYRKEYYKTNKEIIKQRVLNWQKSNPDKFKKNMARYNKSEKGRRTKSLWRKGNKAKTHYSEYYKDFRKKLKQRYLYAKRKANIKGIKFELSYDDYVDLITKGCYYTGESLLNESGRGLDRINNKLGYTKENVLPCLGWVNKMRNNFLTVEETKLAAQAVIKYRLEKKDAKK